MEVGAMGQKSQQQIPSGMEGVSKGRGVWRRTARRVLSSSLCLVAAGLATSISGAQSTPAAPLVLPYYHTVFAGSGNVYSFTTLPSYVKTVGTIVHGSAPGDGGLATAVGVQMAVPDELAVDSIGNVYIIDNGVKSVGGMVRRVDPQGNITTFAGGLLAGSASKKLDLCPGETNLQGDGCPANETNLNQPQGIAVDPATGDIYISESGGNRIRKVDHTTYIMTTVGGTGTGTAVDGDLPTCSSANGQTCSGTQGTINGPRGIAVDKRGNLYVADTSNSAVRLLNFKTGQLATVVNLAHTKATASTCTTATSATTAGAAVTGSIQDVAFDIQDNMYFPDATCGYVYKVAENPATGMVDSNSKISVVLGSGQTSPPQGTFTNVLGTSVTITASSVRADLQGNLYVGESTGTHVWFWDAATGYMHAIFGGGNGNTNANPGDCYGVAASGTFPYNGCDGPHASPTAASKELGMPGLALDAWGNLYIADPTNFMVHKLALGTNAPAATVPAGNANATVHFGASDSPSSVILSAAPDFSFTQGTCGTANSDSTQDCGYTVVNANASSSPQYEQAVIKTTSGLTAAVSLTNQVTPVCQPAVGGNQTVQINGATSITLSSQPGVGCSGMESIVRAQHQYTYSVASQPSNGTVSGSGASLTYTPNAGSTAGDSFTYSVTDNNTFAGQTVTFDSGASSVVLATPTPKSATATITLLGSGVAATPQAVSVNYNTATAITLSGTAANGATLTYGIVSGPTNGTLSPLNGNSVTYTPNNNYSGADSFTFKVNNGVMDSTAATVSLTIAAPAMPPVPASQSLNTAYQTAVPVTLSATGTGSITYAAATQPAHGTVSGTAPNLVYTPANGFSGSDSFTFTATNANGSATATISITVALAPPVAQSQTVAVTYGVAKPITLTATGGGTLTYALVATPSHGTVTLNGAVATYTPASGYTGADSFTFKANNGSDSNVATVSITVNPTAPVASNGTVTVPFNTPSPVTLVATGTGTLSYQVVSSPAHGTLSGTGSALTYTPSSGYAGTDTFTFTATNAGGASNSATVTLNVQQGLALAAASGGSLTATVSAGKTATFNLVLSGWVGATGTVNFSCSGIAIVCSVSPNPATLNGTTPVPLTVSVVTTTQPPSTAGIGTWIPGHWVLCSLMTLGACALLLPLRKRRPILLGCVALLVAFGISGCSAVPQQPFGIARGTYTLNVSATVGTVSATQPVTLIVQ